MSETAAGSRNFSSCLAKPLLLCALVTVPFLALLSCFLGVWFLPLLVTISVLVLSTVLLVIFTKKKVALDANPDPVQDDELMSTAPSSEELRSVAVQQNVTHQVKGNQILHEYAFKSQETEIEMESESDDGLIRSPNVGFSWICADNEDEDEESTETPDDSVSASSDDNLIEIALPGEEPKHSNQGVVELLEEINDMNEEDNLIEIDIFKFDVKSQVF